MREVTVNVRLKLRHDVPHRDIKRHVREAVSYWGGSLHPDDPLFDGIAKAIVTIEKEEDNG